MHQFLKFILFYFILFHFIVFYFLFIYFFYFFIFYFFLFLFFLVALYMFRTVFPSIIRILRLYVQHQVYVKQVRQLLASKLF